MLTVDPGFCIISDRFQIIGLGTKNFSCVVVVSI